MSSRKPEARKKDGGGRVSRGTTRLIKGKKSSAGMAWQIFQSRKKSCGLCGRGPVPLVVKKRKTPQRNRGETEKRKEVEKCVFRMRSVKGLVKTGGGTGRPAGKKEKRRKK